MRKILASLLLIGTCFNVLAADPVAKISPEDTIRKQLSSSFPELKVGTITKTVLGLYEVTFGTKIVYMSADGQYIISGGISDLKNAKSLTNDASNKLRKDFLAKITDKQVVLYKAKVEKHLLTVFTDLDCGHCKRMHADTLAMNAQGISVRYVAVPRAGLGSASYKKATGVWCSAKPQEAMNDAMEGKEVKENNACAALINSDMQLAEDFGINGTPTCVFEDGTVIPGYYDVKGVSTVADQINAKMGRATIVIPVEKTADKVEKSKEEVKASNTTK